MEFILTVVVLFMGEADYSLKHYYVANGDMCKIVADTVKDSLVRSEDDIVFSMVHCEPVSSIGEYK